MRIVTNRITYRFSFMMITMNFTVSKEREELIPQQGKYPTCLCLKPQLCPRNLIVFTDQYSKMEPRQISPCTGNRIRCCDPTTPTVLKIINL